MTGLGMGADVSSELRAASVVGSLMGRRGSAAVGRRTGEESVRRSLGGERW